MPKIMTTCPTTGQPVATHAVMAEAKFNRLRTGLAFYCSACKQSHLAERNTLRIEGGGDDARPSGPPLRGAHSDLAAE